MLKTTHTDVIKKASKEIFEIVLDVLERISRPLRLLPFTPPIKLKNKEGLQVLITGGYGYGNVGDEAQLNANLMRWKKRHPQSRLTVLSPHPNYTEATHHIHAENAPRIVWFNANKRASYNCSNIIFKITFFLTAPRQLLGARFMRAGLPPLLLSAEEAHLLHLVQRADFLHISGGGFLTGMTRSRLWENALLLRLAHILNTPSILTGQTIGVFKPPVDHWIAKWGLCKAKSIYLRDKDGSENDLQKIGISGNHIKSLYDDALFCEKCVSSETEKTLILAGLNPQQPYIAVNYHYWGMSPEMKQRATQRFAELCNSFIQNNSNYQLLLLPMTPSDEKALHELKNKLTGSSRILSYNYNFRIARGVISQAEWVFTMKHHPIIFAQGEGIPVISVCLDDYYYRKNKGAMGNFDAERYCIDKELFFSTKAISLVNKLSKEIKSQSHSSITQLNAFRKKESKILTCATTE